MVNRKFSSILLGFLFVVNSIINLSALSQDEKIKRNGLVGDYQGHAIPNQKQLGGGAWINLRKLRLEGRKMTAVAAHEANGKEQAMVHNNERTTLKISGAKRSDGKCDFGGRTKFCVKSSSSTSSSSYNARKKFEDATAGYVAINADYRGPKRHPPRHN